MKNQQPPLAYIILLSVLFTSLLFLISLYFQNQMPSPTPQVFISPVPTADPFADWQTYTNTNLGITLRFPSSVSTNDQYNQNVFFSDLNLDFQVKLVENEMGISLEDFYYFDEKPISTKKINNLTAQVYLSETGYCDGPGCGPPYAAYVVYKNNIFYVISFNGDTSLSETEEQILSTFKFID